MNKMPHSYRTEFHLRGMMRSANLRDRFDESVWADSQTQAERFVKRRLCVRHGLTRVFLDDLHVEKRTPIQQPAA